MKSSLLLIRLDKILQALRSKRLLRALVQNRVLVGAEHRHILVAKNALQNLATVIDIGANRGQFSLAARHWAPKARIIAFEPLSPPAAIFRKVFKDDSYVTLHQAAVGSVAGEATIHVSSADDSSSLLPISVIQEKLFPGTGEIRTDKISVGRLTDYVETGKIIAPAMLKLDVQGYELEALRGCEELLTRFQYIYAECSFMELYEGQALADVIIAWLRERDFSLKGVYNISYDRNGKSVQGDFLFEKID
jgi:FkbM family methyltransferase